MKIDKGYALRKISNQYYLIPFGQNNASHKRSIKLNTTSTLIVQNILTGTPIEALSDIIIHEFGLDTKDINIIKNDIDVFINEMHALGIFTHEEKNSTDILEQYFNIANIVIKYQGPEKRLHSFLKRFTCDKTDFVHQHWIVSSEQPEKLHEPKFLLKSQDVEIWISNNKYILRPPTETHSHSNIIETHISLDGSVCTLYCPIEGCSCVTDSLFQTLRFCYLLIAQNKGLLAIHSASIVYHEKAWLFSARSGIGKSTHINFWHNVFGVPLLNGDLNLVSIHENIATVWGIPWCGTSDTFDTKAYPLGAIIFLKRSETNKVNELTSEDKQMSIIHRTISPIWTEQMLDGIISFSEKLSEIAPLVSLSCVNDPSAAEVMKEYIDTKILGSQSEVSS